IYELEPGAAKGVVNLGKIALIDIHWPKQTLAMDNVGPFQRLRCMSQDPAFKALDIEFQKVDDVLALEKLIQGYGLDFFLGFRLQGADVLIVSNEHFVESQQR